MTTDPMRDRQVKGDSFSRHHDVDRVHRGRSTTSRKGDSTPAVRGYMFSLGFHRICGFRVSLTITESSSS